MGRKNRDLASPTLLPRVEALLFSRAIEWLLERRELSGDQRDRAILSEVINRMTKMKEGFETRASQTLDNQDQPRRLRVSGYLRSRR